MRLMWVLRLWQCTIKNLLPRNGLSLSLCIIFLLSPIILVMALSSLALAAVEVEVHGLSGPIYDNVMARLSINLQKVNEQLQGGMIWRLHRQAKEEIISALLPFGYYNPTIKDNLETQNEIYHAEYTVLKGPPTLVQSRLLELTGSGRSNKNIGEALAAFPLRTGDILDHNIYEKGKKKIIYIARNQGFLDAAFTERTLSINRETNLATIHLVMATGSQYFFGTTTTRQHILNHDLLNKYLPYKEGDPYNSSKLFELQSILYQTNYFSKVVVRGQADEAVDFVVPVKIDLSSHEHLNEYSLGGGYATDTGIRAKVDWSNRLFNTKGHRVNTSLQAAELASTLFLGYEIPGNNPRYNKFIYSIAYQDRKWLDTTTQLFAVAINHDYSKSHFKFSVGLELRDETYAVGNTHGFVILLLPSVNVGVVFADDILHTNNGLQISLGLLGAVEGLVSDMSFLQATVNGKAIISPYDKWRLIGRGTLGGTLIDYGDVLPPSLRFYTGGDGTIRGYRYRSIGTKDSSGTVVGGKYLAVGSLELERVITENWSIAGFWDTGTATDDTPHHFYQGVGMGLRFRLPFGQVRLNLASAITEEDRPLRLHLSVGGDL